MNEEVESFLSLEILAGNFNRSRDLISSHFLIIQKANGF